MLIHGFAFFSCEQVKDDYKEVIQNLDNGTDLELLNHFKLKQVAEAGYLTYVTCEPSGNIESVVPYQISTAGTLLDTLNHSDPADTSAHFSQAVEKFNGFWSVFNKVNVLVDLRSLDATLNCGSGLALTLKNGDILVKSKDNMDNIYGFQYKRTVITGDWARYSLK